MGLNGIQIYSIITCVKLAGIVSFLLYLAVSRKEAIDQYYKYGDWVQPSLGNCQSCLDAARQDQGRLYEFGYCSTAPNVLNGIDTPVRHTIHHEPPLSQNDSSVADQTPSSPVCVVCPPSVHLCLPSSLIVLVVVQPNVMVNKNWLSVDSLKSDVHFYLVDIILIAIAVLVCSLILPTVSFELFGQKWSDPALSSSSSSSAAAAANGNGHGGRRSLDDSHDSTDVNDVCVAYNYQAGLFIGSLLIAGGLEMSELYFTPSIPTHMYCFISPYSTDLTLSLALPLSLSLASARSRVLCNAVS
jgi:hypothetical protein